MKLKLFYTDYCEEKQIDGSEPWDVEVSDILHSMDCVLHMPKNFLGIINSRDQVLQFMVNDDRTILIDIPILENGKYVESRNITSTLVGCMELIRSISEETDFTTLFESNKDKPWWKFWK